MYYCEGFFFQFLKIQTLFSSLKERVSRHKLIALHILPIVQCCVYVIFSKESPGLNGWEWVRAYIAAPPLHISPRAHAQLYVCFCSSDLVPEICLCYPLQLIVMWLFFFACEHLIDSARDPSAETWCWQPESIMKPNMRLKGSWVYL